MEECFSCGTSAMDIRLFDGLSDEGLVKTCSKCALEEGILLMKKPTSVELKDSEKGKAVGLASRAVSRTSFNAHPEDVSLKQIVDETYKEKHQHIAKKPRPDLIENFNWIIMRARRKRHITRKRLAEEIAEAESAIEMAEKGVLPEDDNHLISKLQSYLGVRLIKPESDIEFKERVEKKGLHFDPVSLKSITIADLKEMQDQKESENKVEGEETAVLKKQNTGKEEIKKEEIESERDFSFDDMNDLIFRKE
jgi:ribosome-binding protein aMBF1 (putative translation factor)